MAKSIFADCSSDGSCYISHPSYDDLILRGTGWTEVLGTSIGDYQGDTIMVLADGKRRGFLAFGYGSCSGCDALEACDSIAELDSLRDDMHSRIIWKPSAKSLAKWLKERDHEKEWYWANDDEGKKFINDAIAALGATDA